LREDRGQGRASGDEHEIHREARIESAIGESGLPDRQAQL
jgi:hypothetical protein